jgi:chaperonin GroES
MIQAEPVVIPHRAPPMDLTAEAMNDDVSLYDGSYDDYAPEMPMEPEVPEGLRQLQISMATLARMATVPNVAELIEDAALAKIGMKVCREYKIDRDSRSEWETTAKRAMDMAKQKRTAKSHPWPDASNVKYPILTVAALQFAARAYPAIVDGKRIVKCATTGRDLDGQKAAKADRVSQHMSFQLLQELDNWEGDVDTLLHQIPIIGCAFKKVYANPMSKAGFGDDLVSAMDLVVNQKAKSLESVPRVTHLFTLYPNEIDERRRSGDFLDVDLMGNGEEDSDDDDAPQSFLEQHRWLDLDEDGVKEPWIVTVHEDSEKVVKIKPAFRVDDVMADQQRGKIIKIPRIQYFVKVPFIPDPEGGFYDIGFGQLLESLSDVIDTTINQMMDAGTIQNSGGGFIAGTLQLKKSNIQLRPGQYQTVQTGGQDLRSSIVNMEHPGPSQVLFTLLEMMIASAKDISAVKDVLTGETPSNQTATSTMAAIEQGLKVFSAIYKRIFRALKAEYRLIYLINRDTLQVPKYIALLDTPIEVSQQDYQDELDVQPMADPNSVTDMQRLAKASFVMDEVRNGNPHIDPFVATKRALEAARIDDVEELLVPPGPKPMDAITEAGAKAELAKVEADVQKTHADTEKARVDAFVSLATAGIPPEVVPAYFPMPFGDMGQGVPPPEQPPPDMMGGAPPDQMPPQMGGGDPMMPPMDDQMLGPEEAYMPQVDPNELGQRPEPMQ